MHIFKQLLSYMSLRLLYFICIFFYSIVKAHKTLSGTKAPKLYKSRTQFYVSRLHPNEDIMQTLTNLLKNHRHRAITISAAVGSVLHCHIRFANQSYLTRVGGPLEITSLTGTFDHLLRPHIHICVADGKGNSFGGHLPSLQERKHGKFQQTEYVMQDCPIFTTLQIALTSYKDVIFERRIDPQTTYDQLTILPSFNYLWKANFDQERKNLYFNAE